MPSGTLRGERKSFVVLVINLLFLSLLLLELVIRTLLLLLLTYNALSLLGTAIFVSLEAALEDGKLTRDPKDYSLGF